MGAEYEREFERLRRENPEMSDDEIEDKFSSELDDAENADMG